MPSYKMLNRIVAFFVTRLTTHNITLGRWGYHWEINKNVKKYYD